MKTLTTIISWPLIALVAFLFITIGGIWWLLEVVGLIQDEDYLYSDEH